MKNRRIWFAVLVVAAAAALVSGGVATTPKTPLPAGSVDATASAATPAPAKAREQPAFVGSAACAACHGAESELYLGSHHAKALVAPSAEAAKARFADGQFSSARGGTTRFSLRDGAPFVTTRDAGGTTATFPIAYISGVWPLEQYVVSTGHGKLQALGVVRDTRAPLRGNAGWFHVYGKDGIAPNDALFFTAPAQSWNHMCADCHSTGVERRYDVASDSFDTRWAELSVGCEACHGPGAEHVRSARAGGPVAGFALRLARAEPWMPSESGSPRPRAQDGKEVEVCAPCHSRRAPLAEGFVAGDAFLDSFEPELLDAGRYHADGQVEGEVYEWGSFLQSRMYRSGVKCSDCHSPHSGKLYAEGNALCVRCHEPSRFDVSAHSHHAGADAPRCIDCHMPPATFMQIDERRDHSIRIPRPDHSVAYGTPNACSGCHAKESATWARDRLAGWFPASPKRRHFVEALAKERQGSLEAPRALRELSADASVPAIARATALEQLGAHASEATLRSLRAALASSEPLVVYGAVRGAAQLPLSERTRLLLPLLGHRLRAVRVAAAKALASAPPSELPASACTALERAFGEVERAFDVSASRPETQVERSAFELSRGRFSEAETALQTALERQPCLAEARLNRADLERQRHDEAAAKRAIEAALACEPKSAAAHHALGLWQVRAHHTDAAIASLKRAVELAPSDARFSFVLAVALAGNGERERAILTLEAALEHHPSDVNALGALAGYLRDAGQSERAAEARQKLESVLRE